MGNYDSKSGFSHLADVISKRIKDETESPLIADFGEIKKNGSLRTNTFPVSIPKGDYTVCARAGELTKGDRVLVVWVENEAVVVDKIRSS